MQWDAIVLAGGRSSRMGGVDKMLLAVDERPLLAHALEAVTEARQVVAVGPARALMRPSSVVPPVRWVRESPPFGGPAAAVAAGLEALHRSATPSPFVIVVASDLPAAERAVPRLVDLAVHGCSTSAQIDGIDGWIAVDADGRRQPLLAIYRSAPLRSAVEAISSTGSLDGLSMRRLLATLSLRDVPLEAALTADVDTPEQLAAAQRAAAEERTR
ncbi:molybdenum cofactor guanylyltransferase [Curtobacterium ammoniigenes]|uniref:molybdenum cofactor guanylyltransferase n=1 Tax=Curtobacterium ammoniigenes TaxID=395387 RepID=UPI00082E90C4|nr:NTP transferase domain-containing protein [Curtobacterium ammoniigenes]